MKKWVIFVVLVVLIVSGVSAERASNQSEISVDVQSLEGADNLEVIRTLPERVSIGVPKSVKIHVENKGAETSVFVKEFHVPGLTYSANVETLQENYQALVVEYYEWELTLGEGESRELVYSITSDSGGIYGFQPTEVFSTSGGFFSDPGFIKVECVPNGICGEGEDYFNCPADCPDRTAEDYELDEFELLFRKPGATGQVVKTPSGLVARIKEMSMKTVLLVLLGVLIIVVIVLLGLKKINLMEIKSRKNKK